MLSMLVVIIISIAAVGIFVLGMSLTLMIKGRHMDSEISENRNMQKLGIKCAVQQIREEDAILRGESGCAIPSECSAAGCASCAENGK